MRLVDLAAARHGDPDLRPRCGAVAEAVTQMTGLEVRSVDVTVTGLDRAEGGDAASRRPSAGQPRSCSTNAT